MNALSMNNNKQNKSLKARFLNQLQLARKQAKAIDFIIQAKSDIGRVQEEIKKIQTSLDSKNGLGSHVLQAGDEELQHAYLEQLKEALQFVQAELTKRGGYTEQITGLVSKLAVPHDAAEDALQFAINSDFDVDVINKEIQETEAIVGHPTESLRKALHPGATPGIYQRSYLKALQEAVRMIDDTKKM